MSTLTIVPEGITGLDVYQITGPERIVYSDQAQVFEPSRLYRIRARVKNTVRPSSGGNLLRIGLEGVSIDGQTLVGTDGTETIDGQYFVAADDHSMDGETLGEWVEFTGYLKGQGTYIPATTSPSSPSGAHASVAYIRPVVWVNMPDGDGTTQIGEVVMDVLPEDASQVKVGDITVAQALDQDPDLIADHSYSGRTAIMDIHASTPSTFGSVLTISLADGKMIRASLFNLSTNGFMALNLGMGTGKKRVVLPGAIIRDDSWSWIPGKTVFLAETAGTMTQTEPSSQSFRFPIGTALASNLLYFNPHFDTSIRSDLAQASVIISVPDPNGSYPLCVYQWSVDGAVYVGTDSGLILRSTNYGMTWTEVYQNPQYSGIVAFAEMGIVLYACSSGSPGFRIYDTSNGTTWSNIYTDESQPVAYDLIKDPDSSLMAIATGGATGKIYTSPDGTTWTSRYTSSCDSVLRFAQYSTTGAYALEAGGATARVLTSTNLTSWTAFTTYTGYTVASDLVAYGGQACTIVDNSRIYGGTTYPSSAEKTDAGYVWYRLAVLSGVIHAWGYNETDERYELWKRTGTSWSMVAYDTMVMPQRTLLADDGQTYLIRYGLADFSRLGNRNYILV